MKNKYIVFLLIVFSEILTGCEISYFAVKPNPITNQFYATNTIKANEIAIKIPIDLHKYKKLLVVIMDPSVSIIEKRRQHFWLESLRSIKYFDNVEMANNLGGFLEQQGYNDMSFRDFTNLVELHKLQKIYGQFLLVKIDYSCSSCLTFTIMDPLNAKILFKVESFTLDIIGLDPQLHNPVLNAFGDWISQNKKNIN